MEKGQIEKQNKNLDREEGFRDNNHSGGHGDRDG